MPLNIYDTAGDPAFRGRRFKSGLYHPATDLQAVDATIVMTQSLLLAWPMTVGFTTVFDIISGECTTLAASSFMRMGVYADDGGCYPGALIFDAGQIDCSTTGAKDIAIANRTLTLPPGIYWIAAVAQGGTPTMRARSGTDPRIGSTTNATSASTAYSQTSVAAALPAQFSTTITVSSVVLPKVMLHAA